MEFIFELLQREADWSALQLADEVREASQASTDKAKADNGESSECGIFCVMSFR